MPRPCDEFVVSYTRVFVTLIVVSVALLVVLSMVGLVWALRDSIALGVAAVVVIAIFLAAIVSGEKRRARPRTAYW